MNVTNTSLVLLISACNLTWADDSPLELTPLTVGGTFEQSSGWRRLRRGSDRRTAIRTATCCLPNAR